jgi:DNA replication protein DnaC
LQGEVRCNHNYSRIFVASFDTGPGFLRVSKTGAELLFEVFSQRYERGSTLVTSNLPFDEWTEVFGSERLTGALLDRLTHHVHILEMNGDSYRLNQSRRKRKTPPST